MQKSRLQILESMPVYPAILKLALPTILSMVVQIVYNLTDTFFIGRLNDPVQVAAITVALPLVLLQMALAGIFGNGAASYISRLLGAKDYDRARETISTSLATCVAVSIVIAIGGFFAVPQILSLTGASPQSLPYALSYMQIIILGSPIVMLNFALAQLLRSEGAANAAMRGMITGTVVNIILDPLFIFGFNMGVSGAAVATLIGNFVAVTQYSRYYLQHKGIVSPSLSKIRLSPKIYAEILKIGIPASLGQITMSIGNSVSYKLASVYGDVNVAALGVASRVFSIPIFVFLGVAIGVQPLIGYNYGAKLYKRMMETIRKSLYISMSLAVLGIIGFSIFARSLVSVFIPDGEVVDLGTKILHAYIYAIPFAAIGMIFMATLQATGKALPALIVGISRQGLVYIPAIFLLNGWFKFDGLIFAMPVADAITVMISSTFVYFIARNLRKRQY